MKQLAGFGIACDEENIQAGTDLPYSFPQLEAIHGRHTEIRDDEIDNFIAFANRESFCRVLRGDATISFALQQR